MYHKVKKKGWRKMNREKVTIFLNNMNIWHLNFETNATLNKISIFSQEMYTVIN